MPDDFYSLFNREQPRRELASVIPLDPERAGRYAAKALYSECENVAVAPEGQRNHALNKAAFSISQLVAGGYLPHAEAWHALRDAGRSAGLTDTEIEATIASGFKAGEQQPRMVAELPPIPDATVLVTPDGEPGEGPPLNPILDWHNLFATDDDEEEWIIEPLLPARRMVALYSAPKAGKSLLMLEIAVAIARGTEALGNTPDRPRRVLYVDFENDPRGDIRTRLEAMDVGPDQLGNLCYLSFPSLAKFDTAAGAVDLMRHVTAHQCEVVVIDTVSRAVAGEENENDTWLAFYRHTGLTLKRAGAACIRLDHSGKDKDKGMRGGSAKSGDVDAVWRLTAINDDTITLECTDHRMPVPNKHLTLVREEWPLRHQPLGADSWKAALDAKAQRADQLLDTLGVPTSASNREARKALREAGEKVENTAIAAAVKVRKLRLDMPLTGVPGTPAEHRGTPGVVVPGTAAPRGGRPEHPGSRSVPERNEADPDQPKGERVTRAWDAALKFLTDRRWREWTDVVDAMLEGSDVQAKTCSNLLHEGVKAGLLERRGEHPDRTLRLIPNDPDLLVSCNSCFRPTTQAVADTNGGLCAGCFRDTGQVRPDPASTTTTATPQQGES